MVRMKHGSDSRRQLQMNAGVTQLAECDPRKVEVVGSNPTVSSMKKNGPLITTACGSPAGSGVCAGSSAAEQPVDNRQVAGSTPAPRTMGALDMFTDGASLRAAVAQLVERCPEEAGVVGSTPARGTACDGPLWRPHLIPTGVGAGHVAVSKTVEAPFDSEYPRQRLQ